MDSKLTLEVQHFVGIKHFAAKQQLKATRLQWLRGMVNQFWGMHAQTYYLKTPFLKFASAPDIPGSKILTSRNMMFIWRS